MSVETRVQREKITQVWRNWQTRMVQVHMSASSCRFKSCHLHQTEYPEGYSVFLCPLHNIRARLGLFLCPAPGVCSERPFYHSKRPPFSRFSKLISTSFSPRGPKPSTAKRRGFPPGFSQAGGPAFLFFPGGVLRIGIAGNQRLHERLPDSSP